MLIHKKWPQKKEINLWQELPKDSCGKFPRQIAAAYSNNATFNNATFNNSTFNKYYSKKKLHVLCFKLR